MKSPTWLTDTTEETFEKVFYLPFEQTGVKVKPIHGFVGFRLSSKSSNPLTILPLLFATTFLRYNWITYFTSTKPPISPTKSRYIIWQWEIDDRNGGFYFQFQPVNDPVFYFCQGLMCLVPMRWIYTLYSLLIILSYDSSIFLQVVLPLLPSLKAPWFFMIFFLNILVWCISSIFVLSNFFISSMITLHTCHFRDVKYVGKFFFDKLKIIDYCTSCKMSIGMSRCQIKLPLFGPSSRKPRFFSNYFNT